jgi:hypothetical protein
MARTSKLALCSDEPDFLPYQAGVWPELTVRKDFIANRDEFAA